jgi:DNA-binding transcriptional LysR family regulator
MERLKRLADFWRWLPAFRVVGETEHLRRAAEILDVSPSALSRTIQLTEESLGLELFHREGRSLRLTQAGALLLDSVRAAMRLVDDGVTRISAQRLGGRLRVAAEVGLLRDVAGALRALQREEPSLTIHLLPVDATQATHKLISGEVDLVLTEFPSPGDDLQVTALAEWRRGLYCGQHHALASVHEPSLEDVTAFPFVAPSQRSAGCAPDGWPPGLERSIAFYVEDASVRVQLCAQGDLLAALPERLAAREPSADLVRLPMALLEPVRIFAVRRAPLAPGDQVSLVMAALQEVLGDCPADEAAP